MHAKNLTKKRTVFMLTGLLIVFGGIIAFNSFKSIMMKRFFANFEPPAVTVSTVKAKKENWYPNLQAVGNFVAVNGVDVNSEISGKVVKIYFNSGEIIQEGQPLIDIDDSILQAQLKFSEADLTLKKLNYERQNNLYKRGATPSSLLDEALASMQQAAAILDKTKAEIKQKHITAPFSGKLGIRGVNIGEYVTPGQTGVVSLQSLDPLFIDFYLPEHFLNSIKVGQDVYLLVENYHDVFFKGKINAIDSRVNPQTHNVKVQATLPNCSEEAILHDEPSLLNFEKYPGTEQKVIICDTDKNKLAKIEHFAFIPGIFAEIKVALPPVDNQIILPATSISYSLYGNSVYVIEKDNKSSDDKPIMRVKRVFVNVGEQSGNKIIILKGIKEGDEVVSSGEVKLQNGTTVNIDNSIQLPDVSDIDSLGQ